MYNFKIIHRDLPIEHTFVLRNIGDAPLIVTRTHSGCGCATLQLSTNTVPPGQTANLAATLILSELSGPVRKSIMIESNDPLTPQFQVEFAGASELDVEVQPRIVNFGTRTAGEAAEKYVSISAASGVTFRVTGLVLDSTAFTAGIETNTAGSQYRLLVRTNPDLPDGRFDAVAHVLTDHSRFPDIPVTLTQFVTGDIVVVPRQLTLTLPEDGGARPLSITVLSRANKPFAITRIDPPSTGLTTRILTDGPGRYRVELSGGVITMALDGQAIRVVTDRPEQSPISVPISVRPAPKASAKTEDR